MSELDNLIPKHPIRNNVYNKLLNVLNKNKDIDRFDDSCIQKIALNIERGIFNNSLSHGYKKWDDNFKNRYVSKSVTVYSNLNPDCYLQNKGLIIRLFNKEFDEFELSQLTSKDLFPERHQEILKQVDKIIDYEPAFIPKPKLEDMLDGAFKCGKCKSWKTSYTETQTRSCDEPTTKKVVCHSCDNRWRFS